MLYCGFGAARRVRLRQAAGPQPQSPGVLLVVRGVRCMSQTAINLEDRLIVRVPEPMCTFDFAFASDCEAYAAAAAHGGIATSVGLDGVRASVIGESRRCKQRRN